MSKSGQGKSPAKSGQGKSPSKSGQGKSPAAQYRQKPKESSEAWLARLQKNPVPQPVKRDYDIKRQKVSAKEKYARQQVEVITKQINDKKSEHTNIKKDYEVIKEDPIFQTFRDQLSQAVSANNKLQTHQEKANALKDQRAGLRRMLGKYKDLETLEKEIQSTKNQIEGGYLQSIKDEREAIRKLKQMNRLRAAASEQEGVTQAISQIKKDEGYQADLQEKHKQNDILKDMKDKKREKEQAKDSARDKLNSAWDDMKTLWDKKKDFLTKAKEFQSAATKVSDEYRGAEKKYQAFQNSLQRAQGDAQRAVRDRRRREREEEERAFRMGAMEDLDGPASTAPHPVRDNNNNRSNANNRGGGGGGRGGGRMPAGDRPAQQPDEKKQQQQEKPKPPPRLHKNAKKKEDRKDETVSTMSEIQVPYLNQLEQFEALEGYLKTLMPRPAPAAGQASEGGRRKKRRKPKNKGSVKHYLNWVTAFSNAGVSKLLPNRRENVEECLKQISAKHQEWRDKSQKEIEKRKGGPRKKSSPKKQQEAQNGAAKKVATQEQEPAKTSAPDPAKSAKTQVEA